MNTNSIQDTYHSLPLLRIRKIIENLHTKPINGLIIGNFGAFNTGDEAILAGELEQLRQLHKTSIQVMSRFPGNIHRLHQLPAISILNPMRVYSAIKTADFMVAGGGGLFSKNHHGIIGYLFQAYLIILFTLPILFHKPLYIIGISFYEQTPSILSLGIFKIMKNAKFISVRDKASQTILANHNIKAEIFKDNSYLMSLPDRQTVSKLPYFKKFYRSKAINIGIALKYIPAFNGQITEETIKVISRYSAKTTFWLYSLDQHPRYKNDIFFNQNLIKALKGSGVTATVNIIPWHWHPKYIFASFQMMDFLISLRLHSSIFAYRQKIPFIGFSYDLKCDSFLHSIGRKPYSLHTYNIDLISKVFDKYMAGKSSFYYAKDTGKKTEYNQKDTIIRTIYSTYDY